MSLYLYLDTTTNLYMFKHKGFVFNPKASTTMLIERESDGFINLQAFHDNRSFRQNTNGHILDSFISPSDVLNELGTPYGNTAQSVRVALADFFIDSQFASKWDDFKFPVTNLRVNPATSKPDYDFENGDYLFDPSSIKTVLGQDITSHEFQLPTPEWRPHVHWLQSQAGVVKWQLQYKMIGAGAIEPASWTILTTTSVEFPYVSGVLQQISEFPPVDMSGFDSSAINVKVRVSRLGSDPQDTYPIDARFVQFDFHVKKNKFGSTTEFGND